MLQIPPDQCPDFNLDARLQNGEPVEQITRTAWADLTAWLDDRGLTIVHHHRPPVARKRWIGVCDMPGAFQSHCLVLSGGRVIFDTAMPSPAFTVRRFTIAQVTSGLSFRHKPRER